MDLKKVFDQTVRELKREVNKKVLKVPEIEVKILEATSNEPWGPHGTIMGDIAQATRNFNDYQMIMTVLYKRLNDTGRNWRHVYKALTVLEFLVANGAERVIDELQEHTYQIQTLCDFQYMEASGKDQGINVRKKAQTLVALIKDKEKIREVRQKAAANRDKYRGVSSTGMPYRSSSYGSTGGGYGDRDEDRYGGGRGGRDEYDYGGRGGGRDGDRYRDDDSYGRDRERNRDSGYDGSRGRDGSKEREAYGYKDRDSYGSKGSDGYSSKGGDNSGARRGDRYDKYESGASSDRDRDDDSSASRNGKVKGGSMPPPAYEEAVQRAGPDEDREESQGVAAAVARAQNSQVEPTVSAAPEPATKSNGGSYFATQAADDDFDDFDPRGTFTATPAPAPAASQPTEDFFAESATPSFFPESTPAPPAPPPPAAQKSLGGLEDLFGDVSFGAPPAAPPAPAPTSNFTNSQGPTNDLFGDSFSANPSAVSDGFGASAFQTPPAQSDAFGASAFPAPPAQFDGYGASAFQASPAQSDGFGASAFQAPPAQSDGFGASAFQAPSAPSNGFGASAFHTPPAPGASVASDMFGGSSFQLGPPPPPPPAYQPPVAPASNFGANSFQSFGAPGAPNGNGMNENMYGQSSTPFDAAPNNAGFSHGRHQSFGGMSQPQSVIQSTYGAPQNMGGLNRSSSAPQPLNQLVQPAQQPTKKEFAPVKSAIWGDTLSMGLVDLNIAGPKVNPLNDLGIQLTDPTLKNELWGADNPKQLQKKTTSSSGAGMGMSMGKAMGAGSGLGRAGASALPPAIPTPSMIRPAMGPGMGPGMGMGMGMGPQMGGGAMNFNMGMGLNPAMGVSPGMGMGMGVGMGPQMGMGMNQMAPNMQMGMGGYPNQQQQYNGYR